MFIRLVFIAFFLFPTALLSQSSLNISLLDHWSDTSLITNTSAVRYNECWGFVHDNQEYAVAGSTEGTHVFWINNDDQLIEVDSVTGRYASSFVIHRDYKTYQNYLYAVCDEGESTLQIIDLNYLPDSVVVAAEIEDMFAQVHNIFIDTSNALLYACSIRSMSGGFFESMEPMKVFSLVDPLNPQLVFTGPDNVLEVHDAYVRDNIAYLNCGFEGVRVYNFSDPVNPQYLQNTFVYQDQGYNHSGWLSPDGKRYVFCDETKGKQLKNCTVSNNEITIRNIFGTSNYANSVAHNVMLSNDFAYVSHYTEGLRIFDLRPIVPREVAYYDTYAGDAEYLLYGAWGIYSELPSKRLIVSDRISGLFLFDFREDIFTPIQPGIVSIYPNPVATNETLIIKVNQEDISSFGLHIYDGAGKVVYDEVILDQTFVEVQLQLEKGLYFSRVYYLDYLGEEQTEVNRIIVH